MATTIGRYCPTFANSLRSKVATGEKCSVIAAQIVDRRRAPPVRAEPGAHAVVRPSGLRLQLMPRLAAGLADRRTVEIVELGKPGLDRARDRQAKWCR